MDSRPGPSPSETSSVPLPATGSKRKRGGNRGRGRRSTVRQIDAKAAARQAAWADTGQAETTERLTGELDELYDDLRDERKGDPGAPFSGRSASFVSPPTKTTMPWRGERAR